MVPCRGPTAMPAITPPNGMASLGGFTTGVIQRIEPSELYAWYPPPVGLRSLPEPTRTADPPLATGATEGVESMGALVWTSAHPAGTVGVGTGTLADGAAGFIPGASGGLPSSKA